MSRLIGVLSGKGGVGKTTLVSNLGYALTELGHNVTLVDANLTTPHLGLHLGMEFPSKSLHDVLRGKSSIDKATYSHPLGFKLVAGSIATKDLIDVNLEKFPSIASQLANSSDFVIFDGAPSLGKEATITAKTADEILILTNPDIPSVTDALKVLKSVKKFNKKLLGVVVNRVKGKSHELTKREIEKMVGLPVIAEIPEDRNVPKSTAAKALLLDYMADSQASTEIRRLAHKLVGKEFSTKQNVLSWLFALLRR